MSEPRFRADVGPWDRFAPKKLQAAISIPSPVPFDVEGRIELVIGQPGAGKTTFGALRARHVARTLKAPIHSTGFGWGEEWGEVHDWDRFCSIRDGVVLIDEAQFVFPSDRELWTPLMKGRAREWLAYVRKRGLFVIATTQSWMGVSSIMRAQCSLVWVPQPVISRQLHRVRPFTSPVLGRPRQVWSPQWFAPADASIPTRLSTWAPALEQFGVDAERATAGSIGLQTRASRGRK